MLLIRIFKKIRIIIKKIIFKFLYGSRIKMDKNVSFLKGFNVVFEGNGELKIGKECFFNNFCSINCLGYIEIGDYCLFGENVKLYDHNHCFIDSRKNIKDQGFSIGSIKIGNNCWIGSNVTILNNVTIGDNVIIGANCLIYKSIPSNKIVKSKGQLIFEEKS